MSATAFGSSRPLDPEELEAAPVRYPRPSRLVETLKVDGTKARHAAETLGLHTVGDLLEHLPSDSREARTVGALRGGEQATVSVEVRAISARPVRRRGMRPLVEARVFDATGGFGGGTWSRDGKKWLVKTTSVLQDGRKAAATYVLTPVDADTITLQARDRSEDGKELPNIKELKMKRVK